MVAILSLLATVLLVPVISAAPANEAILAGTCRTVAPCVTRLQAYASAGAFCGSFLGITTSTATVTTTSAITSTETFTVTSATATTTVAAGQTATVIGQNITVIGDAIPTTIFANATTEFAITPTITANASIATVTTTTTSTICGNVKRAEVAIPDMLQIFPSDFISSACSCIAYTTPTTTTTTTVFSEVLRCTTATLSVVATETTTAVVTSIPVVTLVSTVTVVVTPTTTVTPAPVTTTPVSTTTLTSTTTIHVGEASVQLASPTPITPSSNGTATQSLDDQVGWRINDIPFDVGIYNTTSRNLTIGINGWVSPGTSESGTYVNTPLPNSNAGSPSWVPYWSDLFITSGTNQGIFYEIQGEVGRRTLVIEYFMSFYGNPTAYTHFMMTLFEGQLGRVQFRYLQTTTLHASLNSMYGTIGVQDPAGGEFNQYSYDRVPDQGLDIEWQPATNQWTEVSLGTC